MGSSNYYFNLYKQKMHDAKNFEENLKDLNKIFRNVSDNFYDDIRSANVKINDMIDDLNKSIRYNHKFTSQVNEWSIEKEKDPYADDFLKNVISEFAEEIGKLSILLNNAIADRDYYYTRYQEAENEEKLAILSKLF